jgi:hypothetical protein
MIASLLRWKNATKTLKINPTEYDSKLSKQGVYR